MHLTLGKSIHRHFLKHPFFNTSVDKYFKWIPFALVFAGDLVHIRTRSNWKKQLLLTGLTEAMRYLIVDNLKKSISEHRPFPSTGNNSFPSGHTASSFAGAEFMRRELKNDVPVLSWTGYVCAVATATIRLKKNRHWLTDVVVGAAVGILSARIAYSILNRKEQKEEENNIEPLVIMEDPGGVSRVY